MYFRAAHGAERSKRLLRSAPCAARTSSWRSRMDTLTLLVALAVPLAEPDLPTRAHAILKANCYRCHGKDGENEGGLNYVVDLRTLVSRNKVVPGKPDDSILFQRITANRRPMPPKGETPRPTAAETMIGSFTRS